MSEHSYNPNIPSEAVPVTQGRLNSFKTTLENYDGHEEMASISFLAYDGREIAGVQLKPGLEKNSQTLVLTLADDETHRFVTDHRGLHARTYVLGRGDEGLIITRRDHNPKKAKDAVIEQPHISELEVARLIEVLGVAQEQLDWQRAHLLKSA